MKNKSRSGILVIVLHINEDSPIVLERKFPDLGEDKLLTRRDMGGRWDLPPQV